MFWDAGSLFEVRAMGMVRFHEMLQRQFAADMG